MFANSLRWRLQFWLGLVLLAILVGFGLAIYRLESINRLQQLDAELERRLAPLHFAARASGEDRSRLPPEHDGNWPEQRREPSVEERRAVLEEILLGPRASPFFDELDRNGLYFAIWSREGELLVKSDNAPQVVAMPERVGRGGAITVRTLDGRREAFQYTAGAQPILVGQSLESLYLEQRQFLLQLLLIGTAVLLVGIGGGWWLTTRAIRPIEDISAAAGRISAGNLSERVTADDPDNEIGRLAAVLNDTFARLESAFDQQKRFVADAAHELRTPLAVLITEAQTILSRERSAAEYRESIEDNLEAAQQLRGLTESLLELAHLESSGEAPLRERFELAGIVRASIDQLAPLAAQRNIDVTTDLTPVRAIGDESQVTRVITNLLSNAIYYNYEGGSVAVRLLEDDGAACFTVTNTGEGIDADVLPCVFDRFYRADKARSRADGRSGLGLAISKAIVDAHDGTITVKSNAGETTFEVCLPVAEPDNIDA